MGYFLAFGLVFVGYSLVDWGHYVLKHESVSLWWLMTGQGSKDGGTAGKDTSHDVAPNLKSGDPANPMTGSRITPAGYAQTPKYTRTTK